MSETTRDFEKAWLSEAERRLAGGVPLDAREMIVGLREKLPRGFKPQDVRPELRYGIGPSVEGIRAIGDPSGLIPKIEQAICWIRDRLLKEPHLDIVRAEELAGGLGVPLGQAGRILMLVSSLGQFSSGGSGSSDAYTQINLGRDDVVVEYLAFKSIDDLLDRRAQSRRESRVVPELFLPGPSEPEVKRGTAFVVMSMDPHDGALVDVLEAIKAVCARYRIVASRIDDLEFADTITGRILELIETSEYIIADLSGERPNVYYEVGYAHAIGKKPILYRRAGTRLHFDLSVHNVPEYQSATHLGRLLTGRLKAILGHDAGPSDNDRDV